MCICFLLAAFSAVVTTERPVTIDFGPDGEGGYPAFVVKALDGAAEAGLHVVYATHPDGLGPKGDFWRETSARYLGPNVDLPILPANIDRYDDFTVKAGGTYRAPLCQGLVRYAKLSTATKGAKISVEDFRLQNDGVHATEEPTGSFSCSDDRLNGVWKASVRTCQLAAIPAREKPLAVKCAWTNVVLGPTYAYVSDGAKRDRLVWSGDLWWADLNYYYAFDPKIPYLKGSILMLAENQTPEGFVQACPYPERHGNLKAGEWGPFESDEFAAWLIPVVCNYRLYTGDEETVRRVLPSLKKLMAYLESHCREDGLFEQRLETSKNAGALRFGANSTDHRAYMDILLQACRRGMSELTGEKSYAERAAQVAPAVKKAYDIGDGMYRFSIEKRDRNYEATSLNYALGDPDGRAYPLRWRKQIWHAKFEAMAVRSLFDGGFGDEALKAIEAHNWFKILDPNWKGLRTTYECMYMNTKNWGDEAHPDTAIAGILSRAILGVVPTKPGWSEFKFDPHPPKSVTWAKGTVPTPKGLIRVEWKREGDRIVEQLTVPDGLVRTFGSLEEGFLNPPREVRPQTWWHWMNGNVSKEGITADLEAIAGAGLGGVHLFDAGCEIPPGPVAFNTPAWDEHIRFACAEARRLGLEVIIPNCSGWSSSGGPWNAASNSMKIVTTSETPVKGGTTFRGTLPLPKNTNGFYEDIAVMAIPDVGAERVLTKADEKLTVDAHGSSAFEFALDAPFEATALAVQIQPSGWIGQHRAFVTVETSEDGKNWTKGGEIVLPLAIDSIIITSVQNIPFEKPLTARHWRLSFAPQQIPGSIKTCTIGKLALLNRAVIPGFEGKTFVLRDQKPYPAYPSIGPAVAKDAIVDLSSQVKADGSLEWSAPSGKDWKLLRIGYKSNGKKNHPASRFGCGFEVDKLSRTALDFHFEAYVGKLCRALGDLAGDHGSGLVGTLVDSYEIGCQNWTQGFEAEFEKRAGYSIRPFLPVLVGYVVGNAPETERFLDDFRRVIAALFCENYPGALQAKCRQYGLKFYLEPYGNCPADDLEYGYFCDVPMSEFWCGEKCNRGTGVTRMVASMAHVFGKPVVGAEAFTAAPGPWGGKWQSDLWSMKTQGDLAYCEGVNKFIYHRFAHQPWPKGCRYLPGMTMGQWGTHFDRTNTWWPYVGELIRYQTRCQYLLTEGRFVADAAVYLGDQMPCTLTPYDDRLVPEGLNCDAINLRGIRSLKVENGQLVTPGGIRYRLLALPDRPLVRPEAIAAVEAVRKAGGLVCKRSEMKLHLPPVDFSYSGTTDDVKYVHRKYADGTDGYFVAYADRTQPAELKLSFRMTGKVPEFWKPATGEIVRAAEWREENGRTVVTWRADPGDSVFVMFRTKSVAEVERVEKVERVERVEGTWTLTLPNGKSKMLDKLVSWTELDDPDFKYFSGTATYEWKMENGKRKKECGVRDGERIYLNLGEVKNLAEVTVNGKVYPVLWKPPFRLDITSSLIPDPLSLSIKVTNLWPNRLIGDDFKPEDCEWKSARGGIKEIPQWVKDGKPSPSGRTAFTTWKHWTKEDQLLPSGMLGPVRLEIARVVSGPLTFKMHTDENWWGLGAGWGRDMPFTCESNFTADLRTTNNGHPVMPMLVSDRGRYLWCDEPIAVTITNGQLTVVSDKGQIELKEGYGDLRGAFLAAAKAHFPASGKSPDPLFFSAPQLNSWVELTYHQNEKDILAYAKSMQANGVPPGILMIDDTWQYDYGTWEFDPRKFADPKGMVAKLHADGYKVLLWTCPFVSMDSPGYRELADCGGVKGKGGFVMNEKGVPHPVKWWNGYSAMLDLTHPQGRSWFGRQLDRLQRDFGIDGFKLDGGNFFHYAEPGLVAYDKDAAPAFQSQAYGKVALAYPMSECRALFRLGGQPIVTRLGDKSHNWSELERCVTDMLACGICGYPFICPDMIGGGSWIAFDPKLAPYPFDEELFVRSAQVHALCPMMQFSASPWRLLSESGQAAIREAVKIRQRFAGRFVKLAEESGRTGEPMMRLMGYQFPGCGYSAVKDQFMMGDFLLVAPQLKKGAATRTVEIPAGTWVADDGKEFTGPIKLTVGTPLDRIPHFVRK